MVASQYCCRRTWEKIKNNGVGGEELLVVGIMPASEILAK